MYAKILRKILQLQYRRVRLPVKWVSIKRKTIEYLRSFHKNRRIIRFLKRHMVQKKKIGH